MKTINKIITGTAISALAGLGLFGVYKRMENLILTEKDFRNAKWGLYENKEGQLNYEYFKEDGFYKCTWNKGEYIFYSDLINHEKRSGYIWLPDLDGNGIIGKQKPEKWISGEELFKITEEEEK